LLYTRLTLQPVAWGTGNDGESSCSGLIDRVRRHEITDLILLPGRKFQSQDLINVAELWTNHHRDHNEPLPNLRSIQASGHTVSIEALRILGTALIHMSSLEHLAIGDCSMGDEGIQALVDGIVTAATNNNNNNNKTIALKRLDLSFKGLGWKSLKCLGTVVDKFPCLECLDLSRNTFRIDDHEELLLQGFFPSLTELNLNDCGLEQMTLQSILSGCTRKCKVLNLSNNPQLQNALLPTVATHLPQLEHLVASNCGISTIILTNHSNHHHNDDDDMVPVVLLSQCRILDMSENQLTANAITTLLAHQQQMPHLKEFNIGSNPTLGPQGIMALALHIGHSVETLDVSSSNGGMEGMLALMKMAMTSSRLTNVRLFDSKLGSQGFQALSDLFSSCHTNNNNDDHSDHHRLTMLDVAGNGADEVAVANLIATAAPFVDSLIVGGNTGGPLVEEAIQVAKRMYPHYDVARDILQRS
jgi:Ran GTPase-activating protein (RanGAP) involved in mRNA processing and transport